MKNLLRLLLIREDEKTTVFYFLSFFFIVGCGLAMGKASAEALFFKRYGIEYLPVMYFALGILLSLVSIIYASFADRMSAEKFYLRIFLVFLILLLLSWAGMNQFKSQSIYPVYFLIYEAISEILLIHSALYLSQNLDSFKSKRLSPVIFSGSQLGLIFGGVVVAILAPQIGTNNIILLWCCLLLVAMLMIIIRHKVKGPSAYYFKVSSRLSLQQSINTIKQGIHFSRHSALLRATSIAFFFLVIAFYTLHFITNQIYNDYFTEEAQLTAFFGILTAITSFIGIVIQVFITNRAIKKFGVQKLNIAFPVSITVSFFALLLSLKLPAALLGSFVKDTLNPALNNPVRNLIMTVLPKNIQGRIRAVSIGIILPAALVSCSLILLLAQHFENSYYFLVPGLISGLLLILYSLRVNQSYLKTLIHHLKEQVYLADESSPTESYEDLQREFTNNIKQEDNKLITSYSKLLFAADPVKACHIFDQNLHLTRSKTTDKLLSMMATQSLSPLNRVLKNIDEFEFFDQHNKATLLTLLFDATELKAAPYVEAALDNNNPRLCASGIFGAFSYKDASHNERAIAKWKNLTQGNIQQNAASLSLCRFLNKTGNHKSKLIENYINMLPALLTSSNKAYQLEALKILSKWQHGISTEIKNIIPQLAHEPHPQTRASAISCAHLLGPETSLPLLLQSLDDGHATVRDQAVAQLLSETDNADHVATLWLTDNNNFTTPRAQHSLLMHLLKQGIRTQTLRDVVHSKTLIARQYYDAKQLLSPYKNKNSAYYLTYTTITERIDQTIQLLLGALQHVEQQDLALVAKAAISSTDPLLIASACDALKNLNNKTLSDLMIDLLQDDFELKKNYILSFTDVTDALDWCCRQDNWLHDCASEALRND